MRKSKRQRGLEPSPVVRARAAEHAVDANVSQVLHLSPRGDANVGIMERSALTRGAAAARERDAEENRASEDRSARRACYARRVDAPSAQGRPPRRRAGRVGHPAGGEIFSKMMKKLSKSSIFECNFRQNFRNF